MKLLFSYQLTAILAAASASSLTLPYQDCTSGTCNTKNTQIVADSSSNLAGVSVSGNSIKMSPSRLYLANEAGNAYESFKLKNRKLTFTVDVSNVPCGGNAAFYFSGMSFSSAVGSGYCDAQISCNEMDIFEGSIGAAAVTPHPCYSADQSNSPSQCSSWGYGINTRNVADIGQIDMTKPFTVTTTFATDGGSDSGLLSSISQTYTQGSNTVNIGSINEANFASLPSAQYGGGMAKMSAGLDAGMVFVLSLWGSPNTDVMSWLDGFPSNSKCSALSGVTAQTATFSNFILSTISGATSGNSGNGNGTAGGLVFDKSKFVSGSGGKVMYAFACDWTAGDIANQASTSSACGDKCAANSACKYFTWTNHNGGTCWIKGSSVTALVSTQSPGAVCGYTV